MRLKSNPKRIISLALAGCMAVSMVPASAVTAFAETVGNVPSITAPNASETVAVTVTVSGSGQLESAVSTEATRQGINNISTITKLTVVSGPLNAVDFQFMSGVVVTETSKNAYNGGTYMASSGAYAGSSTYAGDSIEYLSGLTEIDLSAASCEEDTIPARAFEHNSKIEKIVLPETLKSTGVGAFHDMKSLTYLGTSANLIFPESMTELGESMVYGDKALVGDVVLPANLEKIGTSCFRDSGIGGRIVISENVEIAPNSNPGKPASSIFANTNITYLELKEGKIDSICAGFAQGCSQLTEVVLPDSIQSIGENAFRGTAITALPNLKNVTSIGDNAFRDDKKLTQDIIIEEGVQLGTSVFQGIETTGNITINNRTCNKATFSGATIGGSLQIKTESIPESLFYVSDTAYDESKSLINGNLTVLEGTKNIGKGAFNGANIKGTLTLPEGLKTIGEMAFRKNPFSGNLVIPQSVTTIGISAFAYTNGLDNIIIENPKVTLNKNVFAYQKDNAKLYFASDAVFNTDETYWGDNVTTLNTAGGKIDPSKLIDETTGLFTPEKEGYTFTGWYDANGNELKTAAARNNTYTAKWKCTVSFNANGHGEKPADVVVEPGQMLNNIPSPGTADGWVFDGWYLDSDFNHEFTTTEIINQNTTVYAKWHEFTNTTVTATASKDGEYLLSEPVEIDFKVNVGDDIGSIDSLSLEYGDEVESVKLNGTELEKDKKDYTTNDLLTILNQKPEGTLTVTYNKTGKHTFGVILKDSAGKETSKANVDVTVVEMMMDATVTENGESKESYKANEPVKVTLKVTPSDLDAFKKDVLHLTYGEEVEKVELNGHKLTEKQYKISDLLDMMNSAASQVATYALGAEEVNIPLDVTYKTAGTHAFKMEVKNTEGALICQDSVNVTIAEEQKPDDGKKDDTKPGNPVTTYALTVEGGTVKVNGKDAAANESGAYAVEKDAKVEVTFDKTTLSDAQVFDQWTITPASVLNAVDPKSETISFTMPAEEVSIKAMTRDATIEDDGPGVLGTAAMIGVGVAGTAVLGYQGYMIGTELYLNSVLPAGAAIPQNYGELAKLLWTDAGKPAPAAVLAADATDEQKALTWAVENQLISADKAADASVTRWEVIQTWNKEQEMKG